MAKQESTSTSAKILYRPIGMVASMAAGAIAGVIFKQVWRRASPRHEKDAPSALDSKFNFGEVLAAAAVQGALYAFVKALIDRLGARAFQRATGEWPGN